ncbi:hypothetical protein D3H65_11110 [Paraflavitalea soli]|uniref:HIG1 domain-containing protein n=1 Tax=Paraflavitalea soli TaxID=2315862 RepID=A0A3B7MMG4_9BACT|nr:hypothetical protein [Paraflavitalea soli]AXY74493.1 hypothetical protein D3H65_11110 [Paraflavitalea soli]
MAAYFEYLIPLFIGILCITSSKTLIRDSDANYMKKVSTIRRAGWVLVGVGAILALAKYFSH